MHRSTHRIRRPVEWILGLLLVAVGCSDQLPTETGLDARRAAPSFSNDVDAAAFNGRIRIGVVPTAGSVTIGSTGAYVLRDKGTGAELLTGSSEELTVSLEAEADIRTNYRLQVTCTTPGARDLLIQRAENLGYVTYTEFVPAANCWRVFLGEFPSDASFSVRNAFRNQAIADGVAGTDSFWKIVTIVEGASQYKITRGTDVLTSPNPVVLEPAAGALALISGRKYRGVAEVAVNSQGSLAGINELPLEEYLFGVVPRELPPNPFGLPEAQKAQAVTARTYALANLGKRRADGYDLLPTTSDQVYGGFDAEAPVSTAAVQATEGVVAVHDGRLIVTLYHSTSGGYTANSEDVYITAFSYLRGVPDAERGKAFEHVPTLEVFKRHAHPTNLRAAAEGDFESDWSRYHRWVVDWTADEMARMLSRTFSTTVTEVFEIKVVDRADHGRVKEIHFVTDAGTLVERKDRIRSKLRYFTSTGALAPLRSTLFFIEPQVDPRTRAITGWKAYGGGWGHGVGMSQTGAVGMAERGYTHEQILKHYYQGIELTRMSY